MNCTSSQQYNIIYDKSKNLRKQFQSSLTKRRNNLNNFFNDIFIKKYFFNKFLHPVSSLSDLTNTKKYRKNIIPVLFTEDQEDKFITSLSNFYHTESELRNLYFILRKNLKLCRKKYYDDLKILKQLDKHPLGVNISSDLEESLFNVLDLLSQEYNLFYFYGHKFYFCSNDPLYTFEFDFYCILIHNSRLIHFVIEADGIQHKPNFQNKKYGNKNQHVCDILKQFYLSQLNVHLIRINPSTIDNAYEHINLFITKIINSSRYIIHNPINIIPSYFINTTPHDGLIKFSKYFTSQREYIIDITNNGFDYQPDPKFIIQEFNISPETFNYFINKKYISSCS